MQSYPEIRPQGFDIEHVRVVIGQSYLYEKCQFLYSSDNVLQLIDGFNQLMESEDIEFGAEPLAAIHVAGIMIFMLHHIDLATTQMQRSLFLQRCFDFMACTEETHVHQLCVQIFCLLDMNSPSNMINLIACCRHAGQLSTMSQIVSTCLLWSILDRLTDMGLNAHRLRPYADLMIAVASVNPPVYVQGYMHALNLIVRTISALLQIGPYGSMDKLRCEAGVPDEVLDFPTDDAGVLFRWLNSIMGELRSEMHVQDALTDERMVILEESCELLKLVHNHLMPIYQHMCTACQEQQRKQKERENLRDALPLVKGSEDDEEINFLE